MTKRKTNENRKPVNNTANRRAMTRPEVREALDVLRTSWRKLSPQQRSEKLKVLIGFKCTGRGIAKALGKHESNIRRYIPKASPSEEGNDWATIMKSTLAKEPGKQSTKSASEDVRRTTSKILANKKAEPIIKKTCPTQVHAQTSIAQQTKKITYPSSTAVKVPPVVSGTSSGQENQAGNDSPRKSNADGISRALQIRQEKSLRLATIHEQIKPRPFYDARALGRQGRPLPANDRH